MILELELLDLSHDLNAKIVFFWTWHKQNCFATNCLPMPDSHGQNSSQYLVDKQLLELSPQSST